MLLDKIEVDKEGVVRLVLFEGPTPYPMSTHELKMYAYERVFGHAVKELDALINSPNRTNETNLMAIRYSLSLSLK